MKLSRLYSNNSKLFEPVHFTDGLNVVLAEIRLPENQTKDTHNLGKTTLGRLLDFAFLSKRDPKLFLFKHESLFKVFVFFLEVEIGPSSFLTIRRSVSEPTKIALKKHATGKQNFSDLPGSEWDHVDLPFDRAKQLVDGLLDWGALKPWPYRKGLGYLLRSQDDYKDVFHLRKFAGGHADWKPFLAHLLGFDATLISEHYKKEEQLTAKLTTTEAIQVEFGGSVEDISKIEGFLLLKQKDVEKKQVLADAFDFRIEDSENTRLLVEEVDASIAGFNSKRYSLNQSRKKITTSLQEDRILFSPDDAQKIFEEAGVLFEGQIKKDFQQLIAFNKAITEERRVYLQEELKEIDAELSQINSQLDLLGKKRAEMLSFISNASSFIKYKQISDDIVVLRADIVSLERQRESLYRLQELRSEIRSLKEEKQRLQSDIELDVEKQNADRKSLFSTIRLFFSDIVEDVIDRKALLSVSPNEQGHLEFKTEILDESGSATSADLGHTYRKLLCIAFDLAVLRAHLNVKFPRFVFHDGVFESLDDRKKERLLAAVRKYAALGLQPVITLIDSDLPEAQSSKVMFAKDEIVLTLHDENEQGRLFKMRTW